MACLPLIFKPAVQVATSQSGPERRRFWNQGLPGRPVAGTTLNTSTCRGGEFTGPVTGSGVSIQFPRCPRHGEIGRSIAYSCPERRAIEGSEISHKFALAFSPSSPTARFTSSPMAGRRQWHTQSEFAARKLRHYSPSKCRTTLRRCAAARCSNRYTPCHVPSARCPLSTGIESCVRVSAARMCAGMSSGPSQVCR